MSIDKRVTAFCDSCSLGWDDSFRTISEAYEILKANGWKVNGSRAICRDCVDEGVSR